MARPRTFEPTVVLDQAVAAFWSGGFEATPIDAVCAAMQLSPSSVYGAFGGKRELFLAALDRYMDGVSRDAIARIAAPASGLDGIRTYFANLVDAIAGGRRPRGCFLTNSLIELGARDPDVHARIGRNLARLDTAFAAALTRAVAAGEIAPEPGPAAAGFLVCTVQGLNVLANTGPTRPALDAMVSCALLTLGPAVRHEA